MGDMKPFNEDQSAKMLGCSVALLRKWRLFSEGPAYCKIGRLVRYRLEDPTTQATTGASGVATATNRRVGNRTSRGPRRWLLR